MMQPPTNQVHFAPAPTVPYVPAPPATAYPAAVYPPALIPAIFQPVPPVAPEAVPAKEVGRGDFYGRALKAINTSRPEDFDRTGEPHKVV